MNILVICDVSDVLKDCDANNFSGKQPKIRSRLDKNFPLKQAMKAQKGSRFIDLLFL
jgi:hypothetical protein